MKTSDSLSVEFVLNAVSLIMSNFVERQSIVSSLFDGWKVFVGEGKDFKNQWKQLLMDARKVWDEVDESLAWRAWDTNVNYNYYKQLLL